MFLFLIHNFDFSSLFIILDFNIFRIKIIVELVEYENFTFNKLQNLKNLETQINRFSSFRNFVNDASLFYVSIRNAKFQSVAFVRSA